MPRRSFKIPSQIDDQLNERKKRTGQSKSELVRAALVEKLEVE
jgi:Arc/MetJ-type ribon-helix-helix transcriptional regulator